MTCHKSVTSWRLTVVAYRVRLVNDNEAVKWRDLENPLPDARFLAITLTQAALQHAGRSPHCQKVGGEVMTPQDRHHWTCVLQWCKYNIDCLLLVSGTWLWVRWNNEGSQWTRSTSFLPVQTLSCRWLQSAFTLPAASSTFVVCTSDLICFTKCEKVNVRQLRTLTCSLWP